MGDEALRLAYETLPQEDRARLTAAIERQDWEMAALCVLLNAAQMLNRLGPETMEALLDEAEPHRGSRRRARRARERHP